MDQPDLAMTLYRSGVWSEALGPEQEWCPVPIADYQPLHSAFWVLVTSLIKSDSRDYDDLPDWMTEEGTVQLERNTHN